MERCRVGRGKKEGGGEYLTHRGCRGTVSIHGRLLRAVSQNKGAQFLFMAVHQKQILSSEANILREATKFSILSF